MRLCKLLSKQIQSEADRGTVSVDARKNFSCMWYSMQDYTVSSCDPHGRPNPITLHAEQIQKLVVRYIGRLGSSLVYRATDARLS